MKLFKVTTMSVLPLLMPVLLSGVSPAAAKPVAEGTGSPAVRSLAVKAKSDTVHAFKEAGLKFTLPKGWELETGDKGMSRMISDPEGYSATTLEVVPKEDVATYLAAWRAEYKKILKKNYKEGKAETKMINGMQLKYHPAMGDDPETGRMFVMIGVLQAKKPVIVVIYTGEAGEAGTDRLLDSMKKM